MTSEMPPLDLLVIGGLTIDRFPDGSSAAGGSVLHIARAAAPRGIRVGVMTAAGPEPEARIGVEELRRAAAWVDCERAEGTITFRHRESEAGREMWLERAGVQLHLATEPASRGASRAVLIAPLAAEIDAEGLQALDGTRARGAILQGWLRQAAAGGEVQPLPLAALEESLVDLLSGFDLLVASREDLRGEAREPRDQLRAMRIRFGDAPTLLVTDGANGVWIQASTSSGPDEGWHLPVPWRVDDVNTVGSGDILAAFMLVGEWQRPPSSAFFERAETAMRVVAEVLEARRTDLA